MIDPEAALLMARSQDALGREYRAPLGTIDAGRLELTAGAVQLAVTGDAPAEALFDARFSDTIASVESERGTVRVTYHRHGPLTGRHELNGTLALNSAIPWAITCHYGASRVSLRLAAVRVRAIEFDGGVSQVQITLPEPRGVVPIRIRGGLHQVTIARPEGSAIRLRLNGGAAHLAFDQQRVSAAAGQIVFETPACDRADNRYELVAVGGASDLTVA